MKKVLAIVLAVACLLPCLLPCLLLAGCGGQKEGIEVVFYHTMGANLRAVLQKYIAEFNKVHPEITIVESSIGGYDDVRDQVITELQSGKQPALAYCYPDHVATYLRSRKVVDLNTYINDPDVGLTAEQIADFIPGYYEEGTLFGDTSKMYTLPFSKSTEVMYYNKTFFEANGLSVPDHWFSTGAGDTTSMEYVVSRIKEIEPTSIPLGYDSEANWFITMTEQLKTPYTAAVDTVEERFLFDNDQNYEFCSKIREWYQKGWMTTQAIYKGYTSGLFTNTKPNEEGKVIHSYISIGSSAGATYQCPAANDDGTYSFEVGIAEIPQADASNKKVISQGPSVCMLQQKNKAVNDAAWLFLKYLLTSPEFEAEFSMTSGYVPVLRSTFSLDAYKEFLSGASYDKTGIAALSAKICMEQENSYFTSPAFVGSSDARDQVGELLVAFISAPADSTESSLKQLFKDAYNRCVSLNK